jgi:hypothetical protein
MTMLKETPPAAFGWAANQVGDSATVVAAAGPREGGNPWLRESSTRAGRPQEVCHEPRRGAGSGGLVNVAVRARI